MTDRREDYSWVYIGIGMFIVGAILYALFASSTSSSGYIKIKYRDDKVNISTSNFEALNRSDSTVQGAWYDSGNEYMIIKLGSTYYHYCGMPSNAWYDIKSASELDEHYQNDIRGNYDCRVNKVPIY